MPNILTVLVETIVPTLLGALVAALPYAVEKLGKQRRERRKGAAGLVPTPAVPGGPGREPHEKAPSGGLPWQAVVLLLGAGYVFGMLTVMAWPAIFPASEVAMAPAAPPPLEEEVAEAEMPTGEAPATVAAMPGPTTTPSSARTAAPAVRETPTPAPSASDEGRPFAVPSWLWPVLFAVAGFAIGRWIVRRLRR